MRLLAYLTFVACCIWGVLPAAAAESDAGTFLAKNQYATVTLADYRAELEQLPANLRADFPSDPKRVLGLIDSLLLRKSLAAEAQRLGLSPVTSGPKEATVEQRLAQAWIAHTEETAAADFDRRADQFATRARELYTLDPRRYAIAEEIVLAQMVFSIDKRGRDGALAAAEAARQEVTGGKDFAAVARERSDAPDASATGGRMPAMTRAAADPLLWAAAAKLQPGQVSEPVLVGSSFDVVQLVDRLPSRPRTFEEAKPLIDAEIRTKYVDDERGLHLAAFRDSFKVELNRPAIDALLAEAPRAPLRPRR